MKAARRRAILLAVALALAVAYVGSADKSDAELAQEQYCTNVREGVWPDYHGTFKEECGGEEPPEFDANLTK